MPFFPSSSLQTRLLTAMAAVVGVFALVAGTLLFMATYQQALDESHDVLVGLGASVERTAAIGAYAGDTLLVQEVADGLVRNPLVAQVRADAGKLKVRAGTALADEGRAIVVPLDNPFDASERLGQLVLLPDAVALRSAAMRRAATLSALLVAQGLVMGLLLHVLVRRMVTGPLSRLAQCMRAISPGTSARIEVFHHHQDDEIGVLRTCGNQLLDDAQAALVGERELRAEVEQMGAQYRRIFDASSAGIFVLDGQGRLIDCNPTVGRLLSRSGIKPDKGVDFFSLCFKDVAAAQQLTRHSRERRRAMAGDLALRGDDGNPTWVHCLLTTTERLYEDGVRSQTLIEGVMYDVTARLHAEAAVRHRADHDALTGLLNRAALAHRVEGTCLAHLAVLYLDLDGFKQVNDTWGHTAGDETLRICAQRIQQVVRRDTDWIARIGGDEFLVVMPGVQPASPVLAATARALVQALAEPLTLPDLTDTPSVAVSIGVACMPMHGHTWDEVVEAADQAMYAVKQHGKNGVCMAWPGIDLAQQPTLAPLTVLTALI
ncbi:MAG: diguanylate cyclase [Proteobacteria bacterium]|nr:diguanylate cyclase [Pseudomonadota bacterium]